MFYFLQGFGPFEGHPVNASWVAVQELAQLGINHHGVNLITTQIPVIYSEVKDIVNELWKKHNPIVSPSIHF